jgi:siroheme synthase
VIYMPGQNYADMSDKLKAAGLSSHTPCAVISRATTIHQKTYRTTIAELHSTPKLASPTLLVVGEVVRFGDAALDDLKLQSQLSPALLSTDSFPPSLTSDQEQAR